MNNMLANIFSSLTPRGGADHFAEEQTNLHNRFMVAHVVTHGRESIRIALLANSALLAATWSYISKDNIQDVSGLVITTFLLFAVGATLALFSYVAYWFFLRQGARIGTDPRKNRAWLKTEKWTIWPFLASFISLLAGVGCAIAELVRIS
jgi:hypothetical protein